MDNSVNNNLNNNISSTNNLTVGVIQPTATSNASFVQPSQVTATTIQSAQIGANVQTAQVNTVNPSTVNQTQPNMVNSNNTNVAKNNDTNTYLIVGFFVGFVLLAGIFLLVTGVIGNRNRLTCTKTINEEGFTHYIERFYKLEKGVYTRVENTDVYTYTSLTDETYNEKFGPLLEIKSGVTEYGFGTKIVRDGNVVTITSYNPNFFGDTLDEVKSSSAKEGFTCK